MLYADTSPWGFCSLTAYSRVDTLLKAKNDGLVILAASPKWKAVGKRAIKTTTSQEVKRHRYFTERPDRGRGGIKVVRIQTLASV